MAPNEFSDTAPSVQKTEAQVFEQNSRSVFAQQIKGITVDFTLLDSINDFAAFCGLSPTHAQWAYNGYISDISGYIYNILSKFCTYLLADPGTLR